MIATSDSSSVGYRLSRPGASAYSLSHVALPFPPDDPLFGNEPAGPGNPFRVRLGTLQPRGKRAVLTVPVEQLMRLTWNPFFPLVEEKVRAWGSASLEGSAPPARSRRGMAPAVRILAPPLSPAPISRRR